MYKIISGTIVVLGLAGASFAAAGTASAADVGVSLNLGDVAFGYQDGYWDHSHQWHNWRNQDEARNYQRSSGNQYHDWKHDRDADKGWHE
jgi:hypothetical protein